jgi:hypothetical protein
MLIVIRNEENLSPKANFVVHLINQNFSNQIFYVFKKESAKFKEKWFYDQVQLPSSVLGLILYYSLMFLKSPINFRDGLMVRLSLKKSKVLLTELGFLSMLSRALYLRYGTSARASRLMNLLNKLGSPKIFLIDEFLSLNCLDLRKLRLLGPILYVSQDIAYNRFGFGDNLITRKMLFKLERDALAYIDLVIASCEMESLKYLQMGARKAISYPNIYPTTAFELANKDEMPSISIVLRRHWGSTAEKSLEEIFDALALLEREIKVYMIGIRPRRVPQNVKLEHTNYVPSKLDYLKLLSKSWIGINIGIHMAGTNERKYDYAEAGLVVFSDTLGVRGDLLPNEYVYVDSQDLAAKIKQLLEFGKAILTKKGKENRDQVLSLAEKERRTLFENMRKVTSVSERQ